MGWEPSVLRKYNTTGHFRLLSQLRSELKANPLVRPKDGQSIGEVNRSKSLIRAIEGAPSATAGPGAAVQASCQPLRSQLLPPRSRRARIRPRCAADSTASSCAEPRWDPEPIKNPARAGQQTMARGRLELPTLGL